MLIVGHSVAALDGGGVWLVLCGGSLYLDFVVDADVANCKAALTVGI
ncbi:MAG: hypothetical protein IKM79_00770 [Bacteroidales bacterium]|nr:hypothetical protein [Bacteroidales bacterium]